MTTATDKNCMALPMCNTRHPSTLHKLADLRLDHVYQALRAREFELARSRIPKDSMENSKSSFRTTLHDPSSPQGTDEDGASLVRRTQVYLASAYTGSLSE
jgi:hypothetical protein